MIEDRLDVFILAVKRVREAAGAAVGASAAVDSVTGVAWGKELGDAHPVGVGGDAAVNEKERGAGAEAAPGDTGSVG
jgi:hypothetical protein